MSGSNTIDAYSSGQVDCGTLQELYTEAYTQARVYLSTVQKYDFSQHAPAKTLHLRILTLADLNNPDNFSETDSQCMYNIRCASGAYFGRTFTSPASSNINVYVVYPETKSIKWKFSFPSTIKHELMHAILYRYQWNILLGDKEHALVDKFLEWGKSR